MTTLRLASAQTFITGGLLAALLAAALFVWFTAGGDEAGLLRPDDTRLVARGRLAYQDNCASCHGGNLEGQPNWQSPGPDGRMPAPPHDPSGHTWHHADNLLFELTKYGLKKFAGDDYKSNMPAYEGTLDDEDIIAVLSFIKSTWPPEIRTRHNRLNEAARQGKKQ